MICKVSVIFPAMDKWGDLEHCYSNYKSMLSEKYGAPRDCVENFQYDFVNDDNSKSMNCKWTDANTIASLTEIMAKSN